jgi:hypothetical protein
MTFSEDFSNAMCQNLPNTGDSAGNYHLMNKQSKGIIVNSAGNYQLMDEESTQRMFIPSGIASSESRIPLMEWDSAGND